MKVNFAHLRERSTSGGWINLGLIYNLTHGPSGPESSPLQESLLENYTGGLRTVKVTRRCRVDLFVRADDFTVG